MSSRTSENGKLQVRVRREIDHGCLIERRERSHQSVGGLLHRFRVAQDAGAGVDHHGDAGGLRGGVEVGDFLLGAIVENAEICGVQAGDGFAFGGGDAAGDGNHLRDHLNR
jgi:hypothetical protein